MLGSSTVVSADRNKIWNHSYVISEQIAHIANEAYFMPYPYGNIAMSSRRTGSDVKQCVMQENCSYGDQVG